MLIALSGLPGVGTDSPSTNPPPPPPGTPPLATFFDIGANIEGGAPYQEWAKELKDARVAMFTAIDRANLTVHSIDPQEMVNFSPPAQASPRAQGAAARVAGLQSPSLTAPNTLIDRESLNVLPARTGGPLRCAAWISRLQTSPWPGSAAPRSPWPSTRCLV